jgi:hypothetical protein
MLYPYLGCRARPGLDFLARPWRGRARTFVLALPNAAFAARKTPSHALAVEASETGVIVTQEFGGGRIGQLELALPAVLGIQGSLRDPRYVSDMRIRLASMGGGIEEVAPDGATDVPTAGSGLTVRRVFTPEASRRAEMLPSSPDEAADAILGLLRERGLIACPMTSSSWPRRPATASSTPPSSSSAEPGISPPRGVAACGHLPGCAIWVGCRARATSASPG